MSVRLSFARLSLWLLTAMMLSLASSTAPLTRPAIAANPRVAYVHNNDLVSANSFKALLMTHGYDVDMFSFASGGPFNFSNDQAIIIGDDTGPWNTGVPIFSAILNAEKYTIGIGQGGAGFFQMMGLLIGNTSSIPADNDAEAVNPGSPLWSTPNPIVLPADLKPKLYRENVESRYVNSPRPGVIQIGRQTENALNYPIVAQRFVGQFGPRCNVLWGFRGNPTPMTLDGRKLFINIVANDPCLQRVAYIYNQDLASRDAFESLLQARGLGVDLVPVANTGTFDFSNDSAIIIGDDTAVISAVPFWAGNATAVNNANKPIVGVGEGGAVFFSAITPTLFISYTNSAAGSNDNTDAVNPSAAIWFAPNPITVPPTLTVDLYDGLIAATQLRAINNPTSVAGVTRIGARPAVANQFSLIAEKKGNRCYALWGYRSSPTTMTTAGKDLFMNMLLGQPCGLSTSADLQLTKTAAPNPVFKDATLSYHLTIKNNGPDLATGVKLNDTLPASAAFASVSSSQGSCGFAAGVVTCNIGNMASGGALATVSIVVTPTVTGLITNTASVSALTPDPNVANNAATISTNVNPPFNIPPVFALPYFQFDPSIIANPFPTEDLSIFGIEISQGIQCFDTSKGLGGCADNSLAVVGKKDTVARIYLKRNSGSRNNVPVRLHIFANNVEYIANAVGKATTTMDQGVSDSADVYFNVNFSNDINVSFYAEVDPNNIISETNETNNRYPASGTFAMNFRKRGTYKIVGQRLRYHPSGYGGNQYAGGWAVNGGAADWLEQMLPMRNNGIDYSLASGYLNWTGSLGSGDGQHALIQYLNMQYMLQNAFSWLFGTGAYTGARHVYGWAPNQGYSGGHADMPVYPHAGGLGVVGIGTDRTSDGSSNTDDPGGGALIFGHELVHDHNVYHTNTGDSCGSSDSNSNFPYGSSSIQEYGINPLTGKIYNPATTHDLMSYCPAGDSKQGWVSPFTWNKMFNELTPSSLSARTLIPSASPNMLVVNLTVSNPALGAQTGSFGDLYKIEAPVPPILPTPGPYSVQLRNITGTALLTITFDMTFTSEYQSGSPGGIFSPDPTAQADRSFIMTWVDGTASIVLLNGNTVLATRNVSAGTPSVNITSPSSSVSWPAGTTQTLAWNAIDPDGDPLTYTVAYSFNNVDWEILATGVTTTTFAVDVDSLKGGANVRFRVVATDGVNTDQDETDAPISVPNKTPLALITNPISGTAVLSSSLVVLHGSAFDLEDGMIPESAMYWSSDVQGFLGIGKSWPVNDLQRGTHIITLSVTDSNGQAATAQVSIFVGNRVYLPLIIR